MGLILVFAIARFKGDGFKIIGSLIERASYRFAPRRSHPKLIGSAM